MALVAILNGNEDFIVLLHSFVDGQKGHPDIFYKTSTAIVVLP